MNTYDLTPTEYLSTVERIARINARAEKRGFTGRIDVTGVEKVTEREDSLTGFTIRNVLVETTISGVSPSYAGWTFLARVDAVGDSFTLATVPGVEEIIDRSVVRPGECDHCNHNRARKYSYLVRNDETNEIRNVGSTCIKDFLGWTGNPVFIFEDDVTREIEAVTASNADQHFDVTTVLAVAYASIRTFGWAAASSFATMTTRDWVYLALGVHRPHPKQADSLRELHAIVEESQAKAEEIRDWILSNDFALNSNYALNLHAAVEAGVVTRYQMGLVVSAPNAFIRHQEAAAKVAIEAKVAKTSEFIANVGDKKVRVEGTITSIRWIEGDYGTTVLYTITTKEGDIVKWFASREALGEEDNVEVVIEGTVKKHEVYNGSKQTLFTRCKKIS